MSTCQKVQVFSERDCVLEEGHSPSFKHKSHEGIIWFAVLKSHYPKEVS